MDQKKNDAGAEDLTLLEQGGKLPEKPPKKDIVKTAKDFLGSAFGGAKGKDLGQLVEEFTAEMTLVAEGLSEDQAALSRAQTSLSAQQTIDRETLEESLSRQQARFDALEKRFDAMEKQQAQLQKLVAEKKIKKVEGFTGLLRQATWLAAILAGSWIVVTIIQFFKK